MSRPTIDFGGLAIDAINFASEGNAILGIRGSGKTYTATLLAEELYAANIPFVAFDPIGVWRYLRVPGAGDGIPVVVAGGVDGDLPLTPETAPAIVEAAMNNGISLIVDLYSVELSKTDWKRIVRSCVELMLHKNGPHGLRHIFIEEAAEFAPQKVSADTGHVYAAVEKLARMGGNARLGYTLINQRAEEVNKAVLELCDNLFLHRQKGRHSLTALSKWLDVGNVANHKQIISTLSALPTGQCWAWLAGTEAPELVTVPPKNSLHPDRTTMRGDPAGPTARSPVDAGKFVDLMSKALKKIDPPKGGTSVKAPGASLDAEGRAAAYERGKKEGHAAGLNESKVAHLEEGRRKGLQQAMDLIKAAMDDSWRTTLSMPDEPALTTVAEARPVQVIRSRSAALDEPIAGKTETVVTVQDGDAMTTVPITPALQKILDALAWRAKLTRIPSGATSKKTLGFLVGMNSTGGGFNNYLGKLRSIGLIDYPTPGNVGLTERGIAVARAPNAITAKQIQDMAMDRLEGNRQRELLELCLDAYPGTLTKQAAALRMGMEPQAGGFNNLCGRLRSLDMIEYPTAGSLRASDLLFP